MYVVISIVLSDEKEKQQRLNMYRQKIIQMGVYMNFFVIPKLIQPHDQKEQKRKARKRGQRCLFSHVNLPREMERKRGRGCRDMFECA